MMCFNSEATPTNNTNYRATYKSCNTCCAFGLTIIQKPAFNKLWTTVNWEIFMYENIHVLNIRVNKFSRVPHKNILTRKFVKLKLLCTYRRLSDY